MISFAEVWEYTKDVPGCFSEDEAKALYDALVMLPEDSLIVEVGVEFGRSTSTILRVADENKYEVILVDISVKPDFWRVATDIGHPFLFFPMSSEKAISYDGINGMSLASLVHIDGDHMKTSVETDMSWLDILHSGGIACFHDYGRDSLPDVRPVVDKYCDGWDDLGIHDTLAIRRKP